MSADAVIRRARVARIATVSRSGRPSVNPLYVVVVDGCLWLTTADWTLAARNVAATGRATVLLEAEDDPGGPVVRVSGPAGVRTDRAARWRWAVRGAGRYVLTVGNARNALAHWRQLPLKRAYHAASAAKGRTAVIVVRPETVELVGRPTGPAHQVPM